MKLCKKCGIEKPETEFKEQKTRMSSDNPRGIASPCKQCDSRNMKEWRQKNRERCLETARKWTEKHNPPAVRRIKSLMENYGLTPEEWERLRSNQGGACAICQKIPKGRGTSGLCVDHCHKTGKVRALLCRRCNIFLGYLEAAGNLIQPATAYLKSHAP